eukprot:TRINITY_DN82414_c0_g1_i2.p1 TRINITY_DN82414_c0_g1~~TRINITY_DN82414_c0_g1_i2.p1  ORF type:complete len:285 (-),score=16.04 TRINITY_DN82414_c0_g1_i2:60-914(-)
MLFIKKKKKKNFEDKVARRAISYVAIYYREVFECRNKEAFLNLPEEALAEILQSTQLCIKERTIFESLLLWTSGEQSLSCQGYLIKPLNQLENLMAFIRFPLLGKKFLTQIINCELINESKRLSQFCQDGLDILQLASTQQVVFDRRFVDLDALKIVGRLQRRIPLDWAALNFLNFVDHNGVNSYLGTRYFTQQWVNPTICSSMKVTVSGKVLNRHCDPRMVVGYNENHDLYIGPREVDQYGQQSTWWQFDLGPQKRLVCNYYCIRSATSNFLRYWQLQGLGLI